MAVPPDEIFRRAVSFLQAGQLADAERAFKKLLLAQPKHVGALNFLSVLMTQLGRLAEAEDYVRRALKENSTSDVSFYNYGLILKSLKRPAEALEQFTRALDINTTVSESWNNRGTVYNDLGRYKEAIADFDKALSINANYVDALCNKGKSLAGLRLHDEALGVYDKALSLNPTLAEAWIGRGNVHSELNQYDEGLAAYDKAITIKGDSAEAWLGRGNVHRKLRQYDMALAAYDRALTSRPDLAEAWLGRGNVFIELNVCEDAWAAYDRALSLKPDLVEGWLGRGNVFIERNQHKDALAAYDRALSLKPDLAEAWFGRGNVFFKLKQYDDALAAYDRALSLRPDLAEGWLGHGNVLFDSKSYDSAIAAFDKALSLKPDLAEAWLGRGNVLFDLKRYDTALAAYDKALSLKPHLTEAWLGRGNVLFDLKRHDGAIAAFEKALALKPDLAGLEGIHLHLKMHICDWSNYDAECEHLIASVRSGKLNSGLFSFLAISSSSADQLQCAKMWVANEFRPSNRPIWQSERYQHDRVRVAYLSPDFRQHPVAQVIIQVLELHDRSRFETIGLSIGPNDGSEIRARIIKAFDQFHDIQTKSDLEAATLIRELGVDIVVKLAPHTQGFRLGILALRPAPIQVSSLSAWSSGADYLDYVLADPRTLPFDQKPYFTEQIVHLPDSFFPNDSTREISPHTPSRTEAGLPENAFVFCCFNRSYKLNPGIFDVWMRILRRFDGAVLWLTQENRHATENLRREARARDVDPTRLVFARRMPLLQDHLARYRLADLFLDTLPYGAHTTANDALWAGLPVLTCRGSTFVGRVSTSQLHAIGLTDLVTNDLDEYEATALRLARDPTELKKIRDRLAANKLTHPLFDTARLCRHIEAAYLKMVERQRSGQPPEHFAVDAIEDG